MKKNRPVISAPFGDYQYSDDIPPRDKEILKIKCQCLTLNKEYDASIRRINKFRSQNRGNSSLKVAIAIFENRYGMKYVVSSDDLKKAIRTGCWGWLKDLFELSLHSNVQVLKEPLDNYLTLKVSLRGNKRKTVDEINKLLTKYVGKVSKEDDLAFLNRCLKKYCIKQNKKLSFEKLTTVCYPSTKNFDSARQQVKRECKRAKGLIEGGFKNLK